MSDHPHALPPGTEVAGYQLIRAIGQGGFGIAYEAESADLGVRVAVKEFFPREFASRSGTNVVPSGRYAHLYARFLDKFVDEARAIARLSHPGIVRVRHLERANGTAYMVMDFIDGVKLRDWVDQHRDNLDRSTVRALFDPIIDALATVHAADMLHRDISPYNIMVDRSGQALLIDFGAFKHGWMDDPEASTFVPKNAAYAPPEQVNDTSGQNHNAATDIYALAATMYEVISGQRPATSTTRMAALAGRSPDPIFPLARIAGIPCDLGAARTIDRALSFRADGRPPTMSEFRKGLGWDAPALRSGDDGWSDIKSPPLAPVRPSLAIAALAAIGGIAVGATGHWIVSNHFLDTAVSKSALVSVQSEAEQWRREADTARKAAQKSDELRNDAVKRATDEGAARQRAETAVRKLTEDRITQLQRLIADTTSASDLDLLLKIGPTLAPQISARRGQLKRVPGDVAEDTVDPSATVDDDLQLANRGNVNGMYRMGMRYRFGVGVPQDLSQARDWFEKAAARGSSGAMAQLGVIFEQGGVGLAADLVKARQWYEKAVNSKHPIGMYQMARLLAGGVGGPADPERAATLLLDSAKAGSDFTKSQLAGPMGQWGPKLRSALKNSLVKKGFLQGPITSDEWDLAARKAVEEFLAAK